MTSFKVIDPVTVFDEGAWRIVTWLNEHGEQKLHVQCDTLVPPVAPLREVLVTVSDSARVRRLAEALTRIASGVHDESHDVTECAAIAREALSAGASTG